MVQGKKVTDSQNKKSKVRYSPLSIIAEVKLTQVTEKSQSQGTSNEESLRNYDSTFQLLPDTIASDAF